MNCFSGRFILFWLIFLNFYIPVQAGEAPLVLIYAPPTPASIPLILAAETLPTVQVKIFTNHSQAHALFLKGEVEILCTGLAVGVNFFRRGIPVQIINSHVSGLTWLVTDPGIKKFRDLKGTTLYLPFAGSPIEEVTQFFARAEGLIWNRDITIKYSPVPGATALLGQGRIRAAALPEPFVSLVLKQTGQGQRPVKLHLAADYKALWQKHTGNLYGYPQVGTFVHPVFARSHALLIHALNVALARAISSISRNPDQAATTAGLYMDFPHDVLLSSLGRTKFHLWHGEDLKQVIYHYYQTIGTPLDDTFNAFF